MISVKNITKSYGELDVISDLSFEIEGGILGIAAPKGSGKTSLLNIICGVTPADSGEILVDGLDVWSDPISAKRKIGYLPEGTPLYEDMTPFEYLAFYGGAKKIAAEKLYRQIDEVFELLGIGAIKNVLIKKLSPSDRQKIGLAQTLLGNPSAIILDEFFAPLTPTDASAMRSVIKMLGQIKTLVITASKPQSLIAVCDKVLLIGEDAPLMLEGADEIANALSLPAASDSEVCEAEEVEQSIPEEEVCEAEKAEQSIPEEEEVDE